MLNEKPGLIINSEGIVDNTNIMSLGLIPWGDVLAINEMIVQGRVFINVTVANPAEYFDRQKNPFKRVLMKMNYKAYKYVIDVRANHLKCGHQELFSLLQASFQEFKALKYVALGSSDDE